MEYLLTDNYTLTTHHPASHYGIPVIFEESTGHAFGPKDDISTPAGRELFGPEPYPAAELVQEGYFDAPPDVRVAILSYLAQWPGGPQLTPDWAVPIQVVGHPGLTGAKLVSYGLDWPRFMLITADGHYTIDDLLPGGDPVRSLLLRASPHLTDYVDLLQLARQTGFQLTQ